MISLDTCIAFATRYNILVDAAMYVYIVLATPRCQLAHAHLYHRSYELSIGDGIWHP